MIVAVVGKARSGKDTFCGFLKEAFEYEYNVSFTISAFAKSLKEMCMDNFGLTYEQLWGEEKESPTEYIKNAETNEFWTSREIMQEVGSFYRKIDKDYWVKRLYKEMLNKGNFIISDVRQPNELEYVGEHNGFTIKINRECGAAIHNPTHESETSLDDYTDDSYDFVINNNGSLEDLKMMAYNTVSIINNTMCFFDREAADKLCIKYGG